ncbi:MAG TPA: hypothetical protein DDX84_05690 [Nitrospiraceae bacterium]|nr:hypothetical protein [Nitrospiraceae bacterium]
MTNEIEKKDQIWENYRIKVEQLYKDDKKKPKILKPKKKETEKESEDKPHLTNMALIKGNLAKGIRVISDETKLDANYYAWNGWNFLGAIGKPNRDIYNGSSPQKGSYKLYAGYGFYDLKYSPNFNPCYKVKKLNKDEIGAALKKVQVGSAGMEQRATLAYLKALRGQAKKKGTYIGQSVPYRWEAHHILPMSAFFRYFKSNEINIICRSDYDINSGENMILLPQEKEAMQYHQLPGHWSDHKQYTSKLEAEFEKISERIEEIKEEDLPHKDSDKSVETMLHDIESDQFDLIVKLGPSGRLL